MAAAAGSSCTLDVLGALPPPPAAGKGGGGAAAADVRPAGAGSALLAYGVRSSVVVVEAQRLQQLAVLVGGHHGAVTAARWCPAQLARSCAAGAWGSRPLLASGDAEGGVVVWDVLAASQAARLEDVPAARELLREYAGRASSEGGRGAQQQPGGVTSLAWVLPGSSALAVVLAPALLLLWDVQTGGVLWKRELGSGPEVFSQLAVDPLDCRQLCLCGSSGAVAVLQLGDPAAERVAIKQYRVSLQQQPAGDAKVPAASAAAAGLQAQFAVARGLVVLLLPRELVVFDLELGMPAASTQLPPRQGPPFAALLGCYGSGVCQGSGDAGGLDFVYASHTDGSLSVWVRVPGELRFELGCRSRLTPQALRAGSQASLCLVRAVLQQRVGSSQDAGAAAVTAQTAASSAAITAQLSSSLAASGGSREGALAAAREDPTAAKAATLSGRSLLLLGVSTDGRVWRWSVPLPAYPRRSFLSDAQQPVLPALSSSVQAARGAAAPATVLPQLCGLLHQLPGSITSIALQSCPLLLPGQLASCLERSSSSRSSSGGGDAAQQAAAPPASAAECVVLGAAATSSGHIEVFAVSRGLVNPLSVQVLSSLAVHHREAVRGVRWLGPHPLLLSFSSERAGSGSGSGWRNTLLLTDVVNGSSLPFREVANEASQLLGVRVSPSGAYVLLLLSQAPAELWTVLPPPTPPAAAAGEPAAAGAAALGGGGSVAKPWRVRLVDLPFSATEFVLSEQQLHKGEVTAWDSDAGKLLATATQAGQGPPLGGLAAAAAAACVQRQDSGAAGGDPSLLSAPSMSAPGAPGAAGLPTELLAFSLTDGRSGVLSVSGRRITDTNPRRPAAGPGPHQLAGVAALAALWPILVLGDADGTLMAWDCQKGLVSSLPTGLGPVRRIQLGACSHPLLSGAAEAALAGSGRGGTERLRAAVLFQSGQLNIYELDGAARLRSGGVVPAAAASRVGGVRDLAWLALPGLAGCATVLAVAADDGSLQLLDATQPQSRPAKARDALLREALSTPSTSCVVLPGSASAATVGTTTSAASSGGLPASVVLQPPGCVGAAVLLRQPWVLLLRLLLQAGVSQDTLLYISSSSSGSGSGRGMASASGSPEEDDEVRTELAQLLSRSARAMLAHLAESARGGSGEGLARLQQLAAAGGGSARTSSLELPAPSKAASSPLLRGQTGSLPARVSSSQRQLASQPQQPGKGASGGAQQRFEGDLLALLRHIVRLRGSKQLLLPGEWCSYTEALQSGQLGRRMAVAAALSGEQEEAKFWAALPATLGSVKAMQTAISAAAAASAPPVPAGASNPAAVRPPGAAGAAAAGPALDEAAEPEDYDRLVQAALLSSPLCTPLAAQAGAGPFGPAPGAGTPGGDGSPLARRGSLGAAVPGRALLTGPGCSEPFSSSGAIKQAASGRPVRLWDEELVLADAQERLLWWQEALPAAARPSGGADADGALLERRLLSYVVLGDYATAVAWLMSMSAENSISYYRSSVVALALAGAAARLHTQQAGGASAGASASLHLQTAKVVSAHMAAIGDELIGVPLQCSAGLYAEAVVLLQEAGLHQLAVTLAARTLSGTERALALSRWAAHVQNEGGVWRAAGILTSAGCLQAAAQLLQGSGLPDAAHAFCGACRQAGLLVPAAGGAAAAAAAGHQRAPTCDGAAAAADDGAPEAEPEPQQAQLLFDLLAQRSTLAGGAGGDPDLLPRVEAAFDAFAADVVAAL